MATEIEQFVYLTIHLGLIWYLKPRRYFCIFWHTLWLWLKKIPVFRSCLIDIRIVLSLREHRQKVLLVRWGIYFPADFGIHPNRSADEISNNQLLAAKDLIKYQRLNAKKNLGDTLKSLAIEEPQLQLLYFLAVKYWAKLFGDSPAATRSFSVWMSLLAFPGLYWLCRERWQHWQWCCRMLYWEESDRLKLATYFRLIWGCKSLLLTC